MRISKIFLTQIHFCLVLLAIGIGCSDCMYTQEKIMADVAITGIGLAFSVAVMLPILLPNSNLKMQMPPIGIFAFVSFIVYTLIILFFVENPEISLAVKIIRVLMHTSFLLALVGMYRWYSFHEIGKMDNYCFLAIFAMLTFTYVRIVIYLLTNLIIEHLATSYFILVALPLVLLSKSWWVRLICIAVAFVVLFSSMKRGGVLAFVLGLMVYFIVYMKIKSKSILKAMIGGIFAIFSIGAVGFFFANMDNENEDKNLLERFESVQEDGGSNRDRVYSVTWNMITSQDDYKILTGHGYNAVYKDSPIHYSAHNDFMEITYDYGLIGLGFYAIFVLSFISLCIKALKLKLDVAPMLCFQFSNFFILSNISHVFIYMLMPIIMMTCGIGYGQMRYMQGKLTKQHNSKMLLAC